MYTFKSNHWPNLIIFSKPTGGPLHHDENGKTIVEGVASFVKGRSAQFGGPVELCTGEGAYSRLSYYKEWFDNIVKDNNYCSN